MSSPSLPSGEWAPPATRHTIHHRATKTTMAYDETLPIGTCGRLAMTPRQHAPHTFWWSFDQDKAILYWCEGRFRTERERHHHTERLEQAEKELRDAEEAVRDSERKLSEAKGRATSAYLKVNRIQQEP